jgi:methylmalonyl-CoA mutase, N-terminal domain
VRAGRDNGRATELLGRLDQAAHGSENLMPILLECVEQNLTLGEICGTLRAVWGEYQSEGG